MSIPTSNPKAVALALTVTVLLWASAFVVIKSAGTVYGAGELALLRFSIAAGALGIAGAVRGVRRPRGREFFWFGVTGLIGIALYHPCLNYGEHVVSAGAASLLINSAPVWTAILASVFLKEKIGARKIVGIAVSVVGVALLALGKGLTLEPAALLIVCSAFCHSCFVIVQKMKLSRFGALEFTLWSICAGVLWLLPVFGAATVQRVMAAPAKATLEVAYLGIFPAAIAYMAFAYATVRMPASRVMTFLYLSPAAAMVMAWGYLGEVPRALSLVGGALAISGVAIVNTARKETGTVVAVEEG